MWCLGDETVVDHNGPYLREEILSLKGLDVAIDEDQQSKPVECATEPVVEATQVASVQQRKPAEKKLVKPKWLKMWYQFHLCSIYMCVIEVNFLLINLSLHSNIIMQSP